MFFSFAFCKFFKNFHVRLGKKSKSVSFSRVYVCVKAKLTLVSFFYFFLCTFPLHQEGNVGENLQVCSERDDQSWVVTSLFSRFFALAVQHYLASVSVVPFEGADCTFPF